MRRRRRMGDQALGIAKVVRDQHQLECILEPERARLSALDLERHQRSAAAHLLFAPPRHCDDRAVPDRSCA